MRQLTFQETEIILRLYPRLQVLFRNLQRRLEEIAWLEELESDESVIYAMATGCRKLDGFPQLPEGNISDETAQVALSYRKVMKRNKKEVELEIKQDLVSLNTWIGNVEDGLKLLDEKEKQIITDFYFHNKTSTEIIGEVFIGRAEFFRTKEEAVKKMMSCMHTNLEDAYERVLKLCGVEGE
ncbi:MAG: hypothetical protein ACPLTR_09585 [Thermacetogeniaceae bacterium]